MQLKKSYALIVFFLFSSLWVATSPIGSGSDDNYHLTMAYCAYGERAGLCQDNEITADSGVWTKAKGPSQLGSVGTCFRMDYRVSSECNDFKKIDLEKSRKFAPSDVPLNEKRKIWTLSGLDDTANRIDVSLLRNGEIVSLIADVTSQNASRQESLIVWNLNTDFKPVLTILVAPNGGSISFLENGIRKHLLEEIFVNREITVMWNSEVGSNIDKEDVLQISNSQQNGLVEIWPAYTYGSNTYYKSLGWLATKDVLSSAWNMRFFSLFLIFLVLVQIMFLLDLKNFTTLLFGIVLVGMPAGLFLFSTNNPSQWSWVSTPFVVAVAFFLLKREKKDSKYYFGIAVFIQALFLASAREDSAISAFLITVGAILISKVNRSQHFTSGLLLIFSGGFALWNHQNSVGVTVHAGERDLGSILKLLTFDRLASVPGLVVSNFGAGGPLNLGGFAWFDIQMPSIVYVLTTATIFTVFFLKTRELQSWSKLVVYGFVMATFSMMLIALISTPSTPPGGFIQPRYILPMVSGVVVLALMQHNIEFRKSLENQYILKFDPRETLRVVRDYAPFLIASTISFILIQVRFGNGLRVENQSWLDGVHGYSGSFDFVGEKLLRFEGPNSSFFYAPLINSWGYFLLSTILFTFLLACLVLGYSLTRESITVESLGKSKKGKPKKNS
jgi:hypothetical protein